MNIVITGTPGVGKHTVAGRLGNMLGLYITDINDIARKYGLLEQDTETNNVDVSLLGGHMQEMQHKESLIVGHLAPYVVAAEQTRIVIVLRRNPYSLLATYENRGYSERKSMENAASEILDITYYDARGRFGDMVFQVDASKEGTVQKIIQCIRGKGKSDKIDWLGMVADRGDLGRFFSY